MCFLFGCRISNESWGELRGGGGGGGGGVGGTPISNGRGCSSEILNLTPKRDQSGRGQPLCRPLKETSLKYRLVKQ